MSDKARVNDVSGPRDVLIHKVRHEKADLIHAIEGGERNWQELREKLERYISFQTAADVLGGTTKME